jgi:RNA polymerase sigma-70 factor (ECF subfamily)
MANASTNAERLREWSPLSDEEVVARVLAGETALYEVLMRRYNQRIYRAIRAILKDESEV